MSKRKREITMGDTPMTVGRITRSRLERWKIILSHTQPEKLLEDIRSANVYALQHVPVHHLLRPPPPVERPKDHKNGFYFWDDFPFSPGWSFLDKDLEYKYRMAEKNAMNDEFNQL